MLSGNYGLKLQQQCKNYLCCNHVQKIGGSVSDVLFAGCCGFENVMLGQLPFKLCKSCIRFLTDYRKERCCLVQRKAV